MDAAAGLPAISVATGISVATSFAAGCAVSCGALLALAGASKLYRGARGLAGSSAIRRALRLTKRRWRRLELAAGGFECAAGLAVCGRLAPLPGCAAMAMLGAGFCALLGYARKKRVPGSCGCIQWRPAPAASAQAVSWREIARAGLLCTAGIAGAVGAANQPGAVDGGWFGAGILAGAAAVVLLSVSGPPRTPVCRRRLWLPGRAALRALTGHAVFAAMADSAGPLGPVARHTRQGCADEFWFPVAAEHGENRAVVFQVQHQGPAGNLPCRRPCARLPAPVIDDEGTAMRFLAAENPARRNAAGAAGAATLSAAACVLTLAACGSTPAPGSAPSAPSSPSPSSPAPSGTPSGSATAAGCTPAQLKITLTHTGALAGQAGGYLSFTNDGTTACQMTGWPTVVAQTAAGSATTLKHAHSTMFGAWQEANPLPVVTLQPGGSAEAVVVSDDQPGGTATSCPAPYVRLRVSPPGSSASQVVSAYLPGARTYLPSCTAASGSPSAEASAVTPPSSLPQ